MTPNLKIHHIGCVVGSIEEAIHTYKNTLGFKNVSNVTYVSSQKVNVCFVNIGNDTFIELIEPLDDKSAIARLLKKGNSYYHLGYWVDNFTETLNNLVEKGARVITEFNSEAFNNKKCAFLYTEEMHMIELIES